MQALRYLLPCALVFPLTLSPAAADEIEVEPIAGIGPIGEVKRLDATFVFTEGPAADRQGNVFFTDIPRSLIFKLDREGELSIFRKESNNANGLMFNAAGELMACEMASGRLVAISGDGDSVRTVAAEYQGKRFNAPNDLVIDREGGVYFTDPHFRAPMPLPQEVTAVYYVAPDGNVTRLIDDLPAPNGVILSPDEKTLYVIPSGQAEMMAYPVQSPGKLGPGRIFCTLVQPEGQSGSGGDGLTVDTRGNLYITSALGLQVYNPAGELLGILRFPAQPANCTFGGADNKTLIVTARASVFTAPMAATGHAFSGGAQ